MENLVIYLAAFTSGGYMAWILTTIVYQADEQNPHRRLVATEKDLDRAQRRNKVSALEIELLQKQLVSIYHELDTCYKEIDMLTPPNELISRRSPRPPFASPRCHNKDFSVTS